MRLLVLSAFSIVLLLSFASGAQESYPRPWENDGWIAGNGYIMDLGVWEMWYSITPTANISQMDALGLMLPFHESLEESEVEQLFSECPEGCAAKGPLGTAVRHKQFADELATYTQLGQAAAIMPVPAVSVPVEAAYSWNLYNYVGNWKGVMENALFSAELGGADVNGRRAALEALLGDIRRSGICGPDYAGPGAGLCFIVVDDTACDSSGLWDSIPDMGWYPPCVRAQWRTAAALEEKHADARAAWGDATDQLYALKTVAGEKRAEADDAIYGLSVHNLDKIYLGAESTDVSGVASIRDGYAAVMGEYSEANRLMAGVESAWGERDAGWYKEQYSALLSAAFAYEDVKESSAGLIEDAVGVAEEAGRLAIADLGAAEAMEGRLMQNGQQHLDLARAACGIAEAETSLGTKFGMYAECRMHARIATSNPEMENSTEFAVALAETRSAIAKAEEDGIDTAMERALLGIVEEKRPADSISILMRVREGLLRKAEVMYGRLPEERKELLSVIDGGGQQLAFLRTWFENEECYSGERLDYWCGLGGLGGMESSYSRIRDEVVQRANGAVGNALFVDYHETTTAASLSGESAYALLIEVKNRLGIGGENIAFGVPAGAELRTMDLVEGRERVRTVAYEGGVATIQLYNISPHEEIMLAFSKNYTPCTASDYGRSAVGDVYGNAKVTESMELYCTAGVDSIYVGEDAERAGIDGSWHVLHNGMLTARLPAGRHDFILVSEVPDAYAISKGTETATTIGTKTTVEYMIDIMPAMGLDYVPVWVDESGKSPGRMDIFAYTGERITNKRESSGVAYFEVNGLEEGRLAKVRVRYEFLDARGYVERRLSELENATLGQQAQAYFNNASALYGAGDYDGALAALGDVDAQIEKEGRANAKLFEKHQKLVDETSRKAAELGGAIAAAERAGVTGGYVDEMAARKGYLEEMLAKNLSPAATTSPLEDVDLGWEGRELKKIEKYLKDGEKRIKKEWMALGVDDRNLSAAVDSMEEKNAAFSGTMMFEDGIAALAALQEADAALQNVKARQDAASAEMESALERMLGEARETAAEYREERDAIPRSHRLVSLFEKSPSWIEGRLDALSGSADVGEAMGEVSALNGEMNGVIGFLEGEGARLGASVRELYEESRGGMDESGRAGMDEAIRMAEDYYERKQYAKAILAYENALEALRESGGGDDGILVLGVTALLVIGVVLFLLLGKAGPGLPKGGQHQLRRLKKADYMNEPSLD
ncbi:MAG: hypothetical protein AB1657_04450 [Candidatus Micrarchaeota archaeon]